MPRDLSALANESTLSSMPQVTKSPGPQQQPHSPQQSQEQFDRQNPMDALRDDDASFITELSQSNEARDKLHPYTQTLSLTDVESCLRLEEAAFPPPERATREKFQYRLRLCGELSLGIFTSEEDSTAPTAETSAPVYSGAPSRKAILLGHIVATKTNNSKVTDDDMAIPTTGNSGPSIGHKEEGRTICIHSLAILPEYQGRSLGKTLLKAYIQRMESHGVGDRIALITHEELVPFYQKLDFENAGKSDAQFGGGGWYDMVRELKPDRSLSP